MNDDRRSPTHAEALPLSAAQLRFWSGQGINPGSPLYNMALASVVDGPLDPDRMAAAWTALVDAFPVLRTTIHEDPDGVPRQRRTARTIRPERVDLAGMPDPEAAARAWVAERTARPFVLAENLVDVALLRLGAERWLWYCNQHHAITDAGSVALLWKALARCYFDRSVEAPLPGAEFAAYLEHARGTPIPAAAREHWQARAGSARVGPPRPAGSAPTTRSTRHRLELSAARHAALEALAARTSARGLTATLSLHHVLLALLTAFLRGLGARGAPALGAPAPNRADARFATTIGPLIEVLPLRLEVDPAGSFDALLGAARAEAARYFRHAAPGACAAVAADASVGVLNHIVARCGPFGPWPAHSEWLHPGHSDRHHALRLHATDWDGTGRVRLDLDLNHGWFPPARHDEPLELWWALFDAVADDPERPLAALPGMDAPRPAAAAGPRPSRPSPDRPATDPAGARGDDVVERVARSCARYPDAVAVSFGDRALSYADLGARIERVARALCARGIGAGDRVCLRLARGLDLPAVILGTLRAGAAYVPVDAAQPAPRAWAIIADAEPRAIIVEAGSQAATDAADGVPIIGVGTLLDGTADAGNGTGLPGHPAPDALAYLLYTSGSTGRPKGVMVSRAALSNYLGWAAAFYAGDARPSFPLFTPLGFDLTVTSLFVPLMVGGTLRVYPEAAAPADLGVRQVFEEDAVDVVKLTPAHLALLQDMDLSRSRVRQLIVGGEDLKTALARRVVERFGGAVRVHNEYGPTEATVGCIVHTFDPARDRAASVPIGVPVAGMRARLLDGSGAAVGDGEGGELHLAGPSLALGYWRRPDATALAFRGPEAGAAGASGERLYRTGDRARREADGSLVYLGRLDDQVKLGGVRVELGEIESTLLAHPAVRQCATRVIGGDVDALDPEERRCRICGLSSRHPEAHIDADGRCRLCRRFERYRDRVVDYFRPFGELEALAARIGAEARTTPHCIMLLSGGKDSSYALARLVDLGLSVLAFTLDNGYLSDQAKGNVERVCAALGVEQVYGTTPHMGPIFKDSLERHANVCNGCFKTLYTLSMKLARERGVGWIFTGLSRGQFFETRLSEELFTGPRRDVERIDTIVLGARKAYHRVEDATTRLLDTRHLADERVFDEIRFVDFYRYCAVSLDEMLAYLGERLPWIRPADTGRSTNCLINDVGIHVHRLERGYHNYALPYSWDVRLGHKTREAALEELDDLIDEARVERILDDIGYGVKAAAGSGRRRLALYYVADETLEPEHAREWLAARLPAALVPTHLVPMSSLPLSDNGKVRREALPLPDERSTTRGTPPRGDAAVAPRTPLESELLGIWRALLGVSGIGVHDDFFALGGDSLLAIRLVARLEERGRRCSVTDLFERSTIAALAAAITRGDGRSESAAPADERGDEEGAERFASLDARQRQRLASLLARRTPPASD